MAGPSTGLYFFLKEVAMTIYISQGRYTREAIQGMIERPEDRAEAVEKLCKAVGAKLLNHYITFGEYDFLVILEAEGPMTDTMGAMLAVASTGTVTDLKTTIAVRSSEAMKAMEKAKTAMKDFRPAGQRR
jgi:uncharacterized protein with GYD domain